MKTNKNNPRTLAGQVRCARFLLAASFLTLPVLTHAATVDLSSLSSLASNFTNVSAPQPLTDNASGTYASFDWPGSGSSTYDGTYSPGGTAATFSTSEPLTVSFNFRVAGAKSSIGLYFADATNLNNNILVLFNVDNTGTTDLFRVFTDGDVSTAGAGTAISAAQQTADTPANVGTQWTDASFTFSVVGTAAEVTLNVGGASFSYTLGSGTADWASTSLVLRLSDTAAAAGGQGVDVQLTPIPEPATTAFLCGMGALLSVLSIRRIRRGR